MSFWQRQLKDPRKQLVDWQLRLEDLRQRLINGQNRKIKDLEKEVRLGFKSLKSPKNLLDEKINRLKTFSKLLSLSFKSQQEKRQGRWAGAVSLLDSLSPLKVVDRGYAIAKQRDEVVSSIDSINPSAPMQVQFRDGHVLTEIKKVTKKESP